MTRWPVIVLLFFCFVAAPALLKAQEAAQQFEGFNLQGYTNEGQKAWDVKGSTAEIRDNIVEISDVDANKYGQDPVNLKAKRGVVDKASGDIHLEKDVIVTAESGAQLTTDILDWKKEKDLVTTESHVTLTDEGMTATGTGLKAQPGLKTAQMEKDVKIVMNTEPEKKLGQVVTITCDGPMEMDQKSNTAILNKNVVAVQEGRTLKADKVEIYFDPQTQQIKQLVCIGNVLILQGENSSRSDRAVYNADDGRLILTGRPKLILVTSGDGGFESFKKD